MLKTYMLRTIGIMHWVLFSNSFVSQYTSLLLFNSLNTALELVRSFMQPTTTPPKNGIDIIQYISFSPRVLISTPLILLLLLASIPSHCPPHRPTLSRLRLNPFHEVLLPFLPFHCCCHKGCGRVQGYAHTILTILSTDALKLLLN